MTGGDAKFFVSHKKGEIAEWRDEINSPDKDRKKDAVKKGPRNLNGSTRFQGSDDPLTHLVIAAMTVGKDVSMLFADVVNCMQTDNVELKKLVYLYLINYAKNQPDLAILAVNTFVKDTQDPNPLIRALAVRTMGCIRVDKITEYLCDPLQRALVDEDPYVRKTAAICVAKLFDINPELVQDRGFLRQLQELLADSNPMVVANAVAALAEVQGTSYGTHGSFALEPNTVNKLLAALNECTEWGQVFILESISSYSPNNDSQAESIIERVTPRLQHANCAVVLSAVKVIVSQLEVCPPVNRINESFPQPTI